MTIQNLGKRLIERYSYAAWVYVTLLGCVTWMLLLGGISTFLIFAVPVIILQGTLIYWLSRFGLRGISLAFMAGWFPWMVLVWMVFLVANFNYLGNLPFTLQVLGAQFVATVASLVDRCFKGQLQMKNGTIRQ